jgi:hypothetical protein
MKVEHNKNSWRFIQSAVRSYVSRGRSSLKNRIQKLRPDKRFLSWPHMPKRQIDALVGYDWEHVIEIKVQKNLFHGRKAKRPVPALA